MRNEADNEKLLAQYLLGRLADQEQLQVEELFFNNDQYYERLLAIENELFYDYAQGKLSADEREQFEKRFLTSKRNRRSAILASALAHKLAEAVPVETIEPDLANRNTKSWWRSLRSYFIPRTAVVKLSWSALAIVLLGSIWLAVETIKLRTELHQLRAERAAQEERLQQQSELQRTRADQLALKLKRELDENARLKQELSDAQARSNQEARRFPAVVSLVLTPSFVRSDTNSLKRLYVPPGAHLLELQLNLKEGIGYRSYQAILLSAEGIEKWSRGRLQAKPVGSGRAIVLRLPAELLEEGDYELSLKGLAADGTLEETGDYYYFSIVKK